MKNPLMKPSKLFGTVNIYKGHPKGCDLMLTDCKHNFQNMQAVATGFSDFQKMN